MYLECLPTSPHVSGHGTTPSVESLAETRFIAFASRHTPANNDGEADFEGGEGAKSHQRSRVVENPNALSSSLGRVSVPRSCCASCATASQREIFLCDSRDSALSLLVDRSHMAIARVENKRHGGAVRLCATCNSEIFRSSKPCL